MLRSYLAYSNPRPTFAPATIAAWLLRLLEAGAGGGKLDEELAI